MSSTTCPVCGCGLARHTIDRWPTGTCGPRCDGVRVGMVVGAALIAWAEAIRNRPFIWVGRDVCFACGEKSNPRGGPCVRCRFPY